MQALRRSQRRRLAPADLRVLQLAHAEREHEVPHAADDGERRYPGDEQDGTSSVVTSGPEAEEHLDDPAYELQPPDLDLMARGDRHDDVEGSREDEEEAEDRRERDEGVARVDERHDTGS